MPSLPGKDKTLHFIAYSLAAGLLIFAWASENKFRFKTIGIIIIGLLSLAAIDEITQPLCNRTCELYDWYADTAGILLMTITIFIITRFRKKIRDASKNVS